MRVRVRKIDNLPNIAMLHALDNEFYKPIYLDLSHEETRDDCLEIGDELDVWIEKNENTGEWMVEEIDGIYHTGYDAVLVLTHNHGLIPFDEFVENYSHEDKIQKR
jgi:hypothetical protein